MKPFHVILVAVVLAGGVWGVVVHLGQPTPTPEPKVERPAQAELASRPASQTETPPARKEAPALIGTLRSRNHTIHLYAGRFTVEDANGQVLANLVTEEDFAKLLPELFGEFQQMYAEEQLIADNRTHRELPTGWSYSALPTQVNVVPDP